VIGLSLSRLCNVVSGAWSRTGSHASSYDGGVGAGGGGGGDGGGGAHHDSAS